jgi:tRNA 2-selenouridine synthase
MPLFNDQERAVVGTAYKQKSRAEAIKIGLDYFGYKMRSMVESVEQLQDPKEDKIVVVHCWRGGMRSSAVAWLLRTYGFKVATIEGGYKAFRNWALESFSKSYNLNIIGGYTGSGKTELLTTLKNLGKSVVDLEELAHHKGSTFGQLGQLPQHSQEHFENKLAIELYNSRVKDIWLEDESQRIGRLLIPKSLYEQMLNGHLCFIEIPFEERLEKIVTEYGVFPIEDIVSGVKRIEKKIGLLSAKQAIDNFNYGKIKDGFAILLSYYDRWYGLYHLVHLQQRLSSKTFTSKSEFIEYVR